MHIPAEKVLIAVDFVREGKSLAMPELRDLNLDNSIRALGYLGRMEDVEIVVPGHGGITTQQSFLYVRDFLVALKERVLEQMVAGKGIEEILETVTMEDFSDYGWFDQWIRANVITMWELMYHYREPTTIPAATNAISRSASRSARSTSSTGPDGAGSSRTVRSRTRVARPGNLRKNATSRPIS